MNYQLSIILISILFPSCKKDTLTNDDISELNELNIQCGTANVVFTNDVWLIIQKNCLGCHNNSAQNGTVNLEGYENVKLHSQVMRNDISVMIGAVSFKDGFAPCHHMEKLAIVT